VSSEPRAAEAASLERKFGSGAWHRLHPLSPLVRAGAVATVAIVALITPTVLRGERDLSGSAVQLGIAGVLALIGFVTWLVTRWRIEDDTLRIETGLVKRSSLSFPLSQIQAIDVVRPGLARLFGLAELRLRLGGSTAGLARLAYLPSSDAEYLRARLLALAAGSNAPEETAPVEEHVLLTVPTGRLIGSIALSNEGLVLEALLAALIVTAILTPGVATAIVSSGAAVLIAVVTAFWRRFNGEYRLTVADAADGLRLRSGLVALTAETIPRGRVQAVRMIEPIFWRPLGWCRLEVSVAGKQKKKREGSPEGRRLRAVLPVGSRELAQALLEVILPGAPAATLPPPARTRLKSPLRYRNLAWGRSDRCAVARSGRLGRVTAWVPLAKVQSLRRVQGPLQQRLGLATLHLDTAGRSIHASIRDRDVAEADRALGELILLCRAARAGS
jgi:putative membrane protein